MTAVTPDQMRRLEKLADDNHVSYGEMMETAGSKLADVIREKIYSVCLVQHICFRRPVIHGDVFPFRILTFTFRYSTRTSLSFSKE